MAGARKLTPIVLATYYSASVKERLGAVSSIGKASSDIGFSTTLFTQVDSVGQALAEVFSDKMNIGTAGSVGLATCQLSIQITGNPYFATADFGVFQAVESNPRFTAIEV